MSERFDDTLALRSREEQDLFLGSPEFIDAESGEDLTYLLDQIRGSGRDKPTASEDLSTSSERPTLNLERQSSSRPEYECPKCLNMHEAPGVCWRCRL